MVGRSVPVLTPNAVAVLAAVVVAALVAGRPCSGHGEAPGLNITTNYNGRWLPARATWYGQPTGAGPDDNGGACGIKDVNLPPYAGMTSCGNLPLFKDGKGCGSCYQAVVIRDLSISSSRGHLHDANKGKKPHVRYSFT